MAVQNITLGPSDIANISTAGTNVTVVNTVPIPPTLPPTPVVPTVQFSAAGGSALEGSGNVTITVTLSQAATAQASVNYATGTDGTATAGPDFTAVSGTLTFPIGVTSKSFVLPIGDEATVEDNETVNIILSGAVNCTLGTPSTYIHTILNDDTVPTPATQPVELGVNLETVHDYGRSYFFTNVMRHARLWSGSRNAAGDPVGTAEYIILTTDDNSEYVGGVDVGKHGSAQPTLTGVYKVQYTGSATLSATNAAVSNFARGAGDVCTADLTVSSNSVNVLIKFTAAAGAVTTNIKVMRPGYTVDTAKVWTDEFKAALAPFRVIRCMDILKTNRINEEPELTERAAQMGGDGQLSWADRPSYSYPQWTNCFGIPIEALVNLANETGKDLWLNIPDLANNDYVQGLALYLKANLNAACKVYLEYSNEVWNGIFLQYSANKSAANAYNAAGTLPPLDESNEDYRARHYTLLKLINISTIFRSVFGDAAMHTGAQSRIRPVFADQNADVSFVVSALNWATRRYAQPPAYHVYAIASAPYSGPLTADTGTASEMLEGANSIFTRLNRRVTWSSSEDKQARWYGVAQKHNLAFVGYEGGWDAGQGYTNLDAKIATCYDARAEGMASAFCSQSIAHGMRLFCYFNLASTYSRYGQWGLSDDLRADYPTVVAKKLKGAVTVASADARDIQLAQFVPASSYYGLDTSGTRGSGTGLRGSYYRGTNYNGGGAPDSVRTDPHLNFVWDYYGSGNPFYRSDITDNATKSFSIKWRGTFTARHTGSHTFDLEVRGTRSVWTIAGQNMLTNPTLALTAGQTVPVVIDYVCDTANFQANGKVRFWVTNPSGRKFIVPASYLTPT